MLFKDSCVTRISDFSCTEESTTVPQQIFPAYVGTGTTVLSLDASGLQGLNHGVQRAFGGVPGSGELYVVSHGKMSDILSPDNVHPYGFFYWEFEREGQLANAGNLVDCAAVWKRRIYLEQGRVVTSMLLFGNTRFELDVTALTGTDRFLIRARFQAYDRSGRKQEEEAPARFRAALQLSSRSGAPTILDAVWDGQSLRGRYPGREEYALRVGAAVSDGTCAYDGKRILVECRPVVSDAWQEYTMLFDFSAEEAGLSSGAALAGEAAALFRRNWEQRRGQFHTLASLEGMGEKETFLYHNVQYLLHSCFNPSMGYPIGSPFYFPWCWHCSTFWDSTFLMDGLMRLGDRKSADRFLEFLFHSMSPAGKPFSWMFAYDGGSTVEDDRDIAPLVMCAHAMTAIRHYEIFQDRDSLRQYSYPILKRVALYAAEKLFSRDEEGRWFLSIPVSNDVVEEQAREINQTFTMVWFLTIFRKCLELGGLLGEDFPLLREITGNFRIEQDDAEYYHSEGIRAGEHNCASWIVFLLYPTEGMPFVDLEKLNRTRKKYSWEELYMDLQGCYQPWTEMMQGCSDLRRGDVEEAYRMFQLGLSHTFGPGYFSEIGPMQETVGMPPYVSACGTFLNFLTYLYIATDIWDGSLGIFTNLPAELRGRPLRCKKLRCNKGLTVSASLDTCRLEVEILGTCRDLTVELLLPDGLELRDAEVYRDGAAVAFETASRRRKILRLRLELAGKTRIVVQ